MKRMYFFTKKKPSLTDRLGFCIKMRLHGVSVRFLKSTGADPAGYIKIENLLITDDRGVYDRILKAGAEALAIIDTEGESTDFSDADYVITDPLSAEADYFEKIYRRFHDIPWDILKTRHLYLRETVESDVDSFARIYADPEMTKYNDPLYDIESEKKYVREYRDKVYAVQGFGIWTVILRSTGEIIGRAGLSARAGFDDIETGFAIGVKWQNRGYATEAVKAVTGLAHKLSFDRVNALVMAENEASKRVLTKCGYVFKETVKLDKEYLLYVEGLAEN